ncbi:MAG: GIDE domain-containing protein [Candidatus Micrarchaeota archaeon]|nr:GIDE domain-containing protein [Candidatus Micrarchaeota archaeon]
MSKGDASSIPFIMFGMGLFLLYGSVKRYLLLQKIKNTPTSKVRSAAVGLVELFGKAKCKEEVLDPLSKKKSIFCELIAQRFINAGKHSRWEIIYSKKWEQQFYLEDETGRMLIDPKNGEIDIPLDLNSMGYLNKQAGIIGIGAQNQLDPRVLEYTVENPEFGSALNRYRQDKIWVTEKFIAEDDDLYVLGSAMPIEGSSSAVSNENLVVKKNNMDKTLYISDSGERKILEKMSSGVDWGLVIGFLLSVFGLAGIMLVLKIY